MILKKLILENFRGVKGKVEIDIELLSSVDELFELEMAWLEFNMNSNK